MPKTRPPSWIIPPPSKSSARRNSRKQEAKYRGTSLSDAARKNAYLVIQISLMALACIKYLALPSPFHPLCFFLLLPSRRNTFSPSSSSSSSRQEGCFSYESSRKFPNRIPRTLPIFPCISAKTLARPSKLRGGRGTRDTGRRLYLATGIAISANFHGSASRFFDSFERNEARWEGLEMNLNWIFIIVCWRDRERGSSVSRIFQDFLFLFSVWISFVTSSPPVDRGNWF